MYRANLGPQNIQKEIPLLCLLLEFLQKDTSVSSLIFFPPLLKPQQLNIAGLSYGQQGAPTAYLSVQGPSTKGWRRE